MPDDRSPTSLRRRRIRPRTEQLSASSSVLYRIDHYTSMPGVSIGAILLVVVAVVVGAATGFPRSWVTGIEVGGTAVTVVMVFAIQHTQSREQAATQRKLDELLRALPGAQESLMLLEEASGDVILGVEQDQREHQRATVADEEAERDRAAEESDLTPDARDLRL